MKGTWSVDITSLADGKHTHIHTCHEFQNVGKGKVSQIDVIRVDVHSYGVPNDGVDKVVVGHDNSLGGACRPWCVHDDGSVVFTGRAAWGSGDVHILRVQYGSYMGCLCASFLTCIQIYTVCNNLWENGRKIICITKYKSVTVLLIHIQTHQYSIHITN